MDLTRELAAARAAADSAVKIILSLEDKLATGRDAPADISTEADRSAQDAILKLLSAEFPQDAFRAEEKTPTLASLPSSGKRMWIIDPIDGTRGFVLKNGEYSVMIALVIDRELAVGVVCEPAHNRQVYAIRGGGCWRQDGNAAPHRVAVRSTLALSDAKLIQSHSKPGRPQSHELTAISPKSIIETYSAGVKLARVADGSVDMYLCNYDALNDWDLAAGHILVEEAGGKVTTFAGKALTYGGETPAHHGGLLATNGYLHETTVSVLARL